MKLKKNSVTTKLHKWFYGIPNKYFNPINGCLYFWKTMLMYLLIIPTSIVCLPIILLELIDNDKSDPIKLGDRLAYSLLLYFLIYILIIMGGAIGSFFIDYAKHSFFYETTSLGFFIWIVLIFILLCLGIDAIISHYKETNSKNKSDNLVIEFVKAKYNKYCPKIEWIDDEEK